MVCKYIGQSRLVYVAMVRCRLRKSLLLISVISNLEISAIENKESPDQICLDIEKETANAKSSTIREIDIKMYQATCVQKDLKRSLIFLQNTWQNPRIPMSLKLELTLAFDTDNREIREILLGIAKRAVDSDNAVVLSKMIHRLCYDKGVEAGKHLLPLLRDAYYSEFAVRCFSVMKPAVYTLLISDLVAENPARKLPALRILENLAPKDALPFIRERLTKGAKPFEIAKLRMIEAKISGVPREETEALIIRNMQEHKKSREGILEDRDLIYYYAHTGQNVKVDAHLLPYLKERKKAKYSSICLIYQKIESPSPEAIAIINKIALEQDSSDINLFCDKIVKVK